MCVSENEIRICKKKRTYQSIESAIVWARIINERYQASPEQRPYKCPVCGKFHLTCGSS